MVITCPSCSARYRLNPDKIKGRGAKITCPKCSHVFVVFSDATTGAAGADDAPAPRAPSPPPPPDMPAPPSGRDMDTTSGAFQAVGLDESELSSNTTGNIRVVAPGSRKTRRVRALSRDNMPTTRQIGGGTAEVDTEEEEDSVGDEPVATPRTASELDFRSVGITTWKVKVSIGLIYDFSDISTLKKYLSDKKVTEDDLISHNAKEWTRIGDIPDLDQHFITTWAAAKAAGASGAPKKEKKAADTSTVSTAGTGSHAAVATGSYGTSSGTYGAQPTARTGSHRTTGSQPTRSSSKKKQADEAEAAAATGRNRMLAAAAVALLLVGGGWLYMQGQSDAGGGTGGVVIATPTPTDAAADASQQERIRNTIKEKLDREAQDIIDREEEAKRVQLEAEEAEREVPLEERGLVAVRPEDRTVQVERPQQRRMSKLPTTTPSPQPTPSSVATQTETKQNSHLTYLKHARAKLAEGNFGSALKMVDTAIAKNPQCGECFETRAEIKQKTGDPAGAAADLARAKKLGSAPHVSQ